MRNQRATSRNSSAASALRPATVARHLQQASERVVREQRKDSASSSSLHRTSRAATARQSRQRARSCAWKRGAAAQGGGPAAESKFRIFLVDPI
ncbi:hypothetical protein F511_12265 [Dorcoceras hygrometricum]|uniref:Uncharacterized protein n=1 Tax=Dorcoceras hygrometricum TaxID=472368 RepID=A0A2Z7DEJ0_9LAMI|nr:hypothetical protein F511_12265 [Dorcoceras hygrometricum]